MAGSRYLIDTHCLLWFQGNEGKIPGSIMQILQDPENVIYFNQVSLFEIAIKQAIGKLPDFKSDIEEVYHQAIKDNFIFLPIQNHYLYRYKHVPLLPEHRDPFDRLLIAAALEENVIMLTADKHFTLYSDIIKVMW